MKALFQAVLLLVASGCGNDVDASFDGGLPIVDASPKIDAGPKGDRVPHDPDLPAELVDEGGTPLPPP